jgi:hypothetical protein
MPETAGDSCGADLSWRNHKYDALPSMSSSAIPATGVNHRGYVDSRSVVNCGAASARTGFSDAAGATATGRRMRGRTISHSRGSASLPRAWRLSGLAANSGSRGVRVD